MAQLMYLLKKWGFLLGMIPATFCFGIDISPSKDPGGTTNSVPNRVENAPSIWTSPFRWIFGSVRSEAMNRINAPPNFKVQLSMEPKNFVPTSNAVLKARMVVTNQGKDKYLLQFKDAQHYDFMIHTQDGKELYRYSKDKVFAQRTSSIVLNRNEKLTYEEEIFSASNQALHLPPGQYKLIGQVTAKTPISVETSFEVCSNP